MIPKRSCRRPAICHRALCCTIKRKPTNRSVGLLPWWILKMHRRGHDMNLALPRRRAPTGRVRCFDLLSRVGFRRPHCRWRSVLRGRGGVLIPPMCIAIAAGCRSAHTKAMSSAAHTAERVAWHGNGLFGWVNMTAFCRSGSRTPSFTGSAAWRRIWADCWVRLCAVPERPPTV